MKMKKVLIADGEGFISVDKCLKKFMKYIIEILFGGY